MNYKKILKKVRNNKLFLYASPFLIYLIVALIFWGPPNFFDIHRLVFNPSGDQVLFTWSLKWWPYSITHGINPFVEKYLFNPAGYNTAWTTSIPALALIMAPVTAIWGAMTSLNILALIALPISALSCYYLVFYITKKYRASVLCGFVYGFSSFQVAQLLGHPCFYVNFVAPLVVLVILLRVNKRLRKIPFILILGLLLAVQFGIDTEAFATMILFGALSWLLLIIFSQKKLRQLLLKTSSELIFAAIVAAVILAPFLYYIFTGFKTVPTFIYEPVGYSTDILNFIIPTKVTLIGGKTFMHISNKFTGNDAEQGSYLTIPLILFMIVFSVKYWRKAYVKVLAIVAFVVAVLSLGPRLNVNGLRTTFPLPEALFAKLPLLRYMLPLRFSTYIFLIAAVMLGLWFSFTPARLTKNKVVSLLKYILVIVIIVLMLPQPSFDVWKKNTTPYIFSPKLVTKYIGEHQNILFLPYADASPEFWQQYSDMSFTTINGYLGIPPASATDTTTSYDLYNSIPQTNFTSNFIMFCQQNHLTEIVYGPRIPKISPIEVREVQSLKWPSYTVDKFVIIKVPRADQ
ncbi:MAG TPA: hypothetical protein VMR95_03965 [Candidatus Binatia bacterium]|nr:hypothetical protein [Candidatus Binatia bacterium]